MTDKLQIFHMKTGEVVKEVDVTGKSERQIEQCEMGMLRNMNLDEYSVRRVSEDAVKVSK